MVVMSHALRPTAVYRHYVDPVVPLEKVYIVVRWAEHDVVVHLPVLGVVLPDVSWSHNQTFLLDQTFLLESAH